mgnify:CR=1 FL=1
MADVLGEDVVNGGIGQEDRLAADGHDVITAEVIDDGDADEPREEGTGGDNGGVAKTCEVADAEEGCVVVELKASLYLSAAAWPQEKVIVDKTSCHQPRLLSTKS